MRSVAMIWIEKNGLKFVEVAYSELSAKDNAMLVKAIEDNWDFLNDQITKSFNGEKTIIKNLEK